MIFLGNMILMDVRCDRSYYFIHAEERDGDGLEAGVKFVGAKQKIPGGPDRLAFQLDRGR